VVVQAEADNSGRVAVAVALSIMLHMRLLLGHTLFLLVAVELEELMEVQQMELMVLIQFLIQLILAEVAFRLLSAVAAAVDMTDIAD
jgi:hypothetical protein